MNCWSNIHYLGSLKAVGERIYYSIRDENGDWLGVMVFVSAARRLRHRDAWIGWTDEQRRRRLQLAVNNARFLLLPERTVPNLGSAVLKRVNAQLSADWQERYGHPVLVVEKLRGSLALQWHRLHSRRLGRTGVDKGKLA